MDNIDINVLKARLPELVALSHEKTAAGETYTEAVKLAAEKSGASKSVIRALVSAIIKNTGAEAKDDAEALASLIEALA